MAGFDNDVLYADNVDFSGSFPVSGQINQDGELLIGAASPPFIRSGLLTGSGGISITNGPGTIDIDGSGAGTPLTFHTNVGDATPAANVITFSGTNGASLSASGSTVNVNLTGIPNSSLQNSSVTLSNGTNISVTGSPVSLGGAATINVAGPPSATSLTNHGVVLGQGSSAITATAVGTNGQVLVGATGADPAFATLTSSDSSISFTTGANTLSLQVASGTTVGKTITGDSGGALSPTAGNWNLSGSGSITTSGAGSTLTTQLTGLTNHALLVGAGTTTITKVGPSATSGQILQSAGASADPAFSTATYPSTATGTGKILRADGTNWAATTATFPDTAGTSGNVLSSDGTNWASVAPSTLTGVYQFASGTLTSAQIKNLNATPIQAVAAPGAGKIILPVTWIGKLNYGGTNVFIAGAAQQIQFFYGTATATGQLILNAQLVAAATRVTTNVGSGVDNTAYTSFENVALNLYNSVATEISGNAANDNTVTWVLYYLIVTI